MAAVAAFLALGCVALVGLKFSSSQRGVELLGNDPFLKSYMGADKAMLLGRTHKTDFWRSEVQHGGLFKHLHNMESSEAKAHKKWKQEQLATLVEPNSKNELKDLDIIESRAEHAPDSADALSNLEKASARETGETGVARGDKWTANMAAWRKHADAVAPKYATNKNHPALKKELPAFDAHVADLMKSLGEAQHPHQAIPAHPQHLLASPHSSQQLSEASPSSSSASSLLPASLLAELHHAKAAAQASAHAAAARRASAEERGAKRVAAVEDRYSMSMRDQTESSRQTASKVLRTFV